MLSHFKKGQVYLYDSLQSKMLHPDLKEQLLALYGETDIELPDHTFTSPRWQTRPKQVENSAMYNMGTIV